MSVPPLVRVPPPVPPPVPPLVPSPVPSRGTEGYAAVARWYETRLGWPVAGPPGGGPVELLAGIAFDALELPADAGAAVLRRVAAGPVALAGDRMLLLIAAGAADEVPGLLAWLEWSGVALDLTAVGAGGRLPAPLPPGWTGPRGAAVWLRPPVSGREPVPGLPGLPDVPGPPGSAGPAYTEDGHPGRVRGPDLMRLLDAAATECHRARLLRTNTPTRIGYLCDCPARE
ncbi:SCO3374 family protein [Streptomyces sp. NPDC058953]|uniref:SCO3374 family protein n=1 Tax=unclassified Streptomyces TaxID=2593676 RepID=UPI0036C70D36